MSDINAALVHRLLTAAALPHVYHARLPQSVTLPAVTYQEISRTMTGQHGEPSVLTRSRIQITAWAATYEQAYAVGKTIRAALDGERGEWGTGASKTAIHACQITAARSAYEELADLWQYQQDFFITHDG